MMHRSSQQAAWSHRLVDGSKPTDWAQIARRKCLYWRAYITFSLGLKRLLDAVVSCFALLLSLPLLCFVALCIKLEDRGPIFFRQTRVGEAGRSFTMWKLRSMRTDAERIKQQLLAENQHQDGVTFKMEQDPRITRVGRFIRKYSVDELPQFWNVLQGDMSLVGPRPPVPSEVSLYKAAHLRRLRVKPGITCLWQVGGRSNIDFEGQVRLDLQYIRSASWWQDIVILLKTVPAVLFSRGAY